MILLPGWGTAGSVLVGRAFIVALILEYGERLIHAEDDLLTFRLHRLDD